MLKAVLVKPVRGGGGHRNRNINMTEKLMTVFWKGKEEEAWQTAVGIEQTRQKKIDPQRNQKKKRNLAGDLIGRSSRMDEVKRRSDRAKILTNDGELRKAFATLVQRGGRQMILSPN